METQTNVTTEKFFINTNSIALKQDQIEKLLSMSTDKTHKTGIELPTGENIVVFKGVISQHYGVGESSRNKYKYDQKGWILDEYKFNPVILWQHSQDYGTIGHAIQFWIDEENNFASLFYVDLNTLEPRHATQVKNGYVKGISTGASTVEYMFEDNESGERLSQEEAEEKFGWNNVWKALVGWGSDFITLVITKANLMEYSLVTIGSNSKAIAMQNSISDSFQSKAEEYKKSKEGSNQAHLSSNNSPSMNEVHKKKTNADGTSDEDATTTPEVAKAETENTEADPANGEAGAETNAVHADVNEVATLKTQVETLTNELSALKADKASEIEKLKTDHTAALNKVREDQRAGLATIVATQDKTQSSEVKNFADVKSKHLKRR